MKTDLFLAPARAGPGRSRAPKPAVIPSGDLPGLARQQRRGRRPDEQRSSRCPPAPPPAAPPMPSSWRTSPCSASWTPRATRSCRPWARAPTRSARSRSRTYPGARTPSFNSVLLAHAEHGRGLAGATAPARRARQPAIPDQRRAAARGPHRLRQRAGYPLRGQRAAHYRVAAGAIRLSHRGHRGYSHQERRVRPGRRGGRVWRQLRHGQTQPRVGRHFGKVQLLLRGHLQLTTRLGIENPTSSYTAIHDTTDQYKGFTYLSYLLDDTSRLSFIGSGGLRRLPDPQHAGPAGGRAQCARWRDPGALGDLSAHAVFRFVER